MNNRPKKLILNKNIWNKTKYNTYVPIFKGVELKGSACSYEELISLGAKNYDKNRSTI